MFYCYLFIFIFEDSQSDMIRTVTQNMKQRGTVCFWSKNIKVICKPHYPPPIAIRAAAKATYSLTSCILFNHIDIFFGKVFNVAC